MKATHTPGPWTSEPTPSSVFVTRAIRGPEDQLIAHVGIPEYRNVPGVYEDVANAKLIAAAPDLLQALRDCVTEDNAACFALGEAGLRRRLEAVNKTAQAAIEKGVL